MPSSDLHILPRGHMPHYMRSTEMPLSRLNRRHSPLPRRSSKGCDGCGNGCDGAVLKASLAMARRALRTLALQLFRSQVA